MQKDVRGPMPKRRAVWKASDIRDWDLPHAKGRTPSGAAAAPVALDPDTLVQVKTGKQEWPTRLRWVMDLLDKRETTALQAALASGRPLVLTGRNGRAAMTITAAPAAASPVGEGPATETSSDQTPAGAEPAGV
jgi:hypothetical protein